MFNIKATEMLAVMGAINPSSQAAGTANSGWLDMAQFQKLVALVQVGAFGASATVDAKIQQATDSSGTGAKDVTGKAITQMLAAGGNNVQAEINLDAADLDTNNNFRYVQLSITVGTAATGTAGLVLGVAPRFLPASDFNNTSVVQTVG